MQERFVKTIPAFCTEHRHEAASNAERRELGKAHFALALRQWMKRNSWSNLNLQRLAEWALDEQPVLHTSQISHLINNKTVHLGVKPCDALGQINLVIWAKQQNREDLVKILGPAPVSPGIQELIQDAEPMINPYLDLPLDQKGWLDVFLGNIKLPGVGA